MAAAATGGGGGNGSSGGGGLASHPTVSGGGLPRATIKSLNRSLRERAERVKEAAVAASGSGETAAAAAAAGDAVTEEEKAAAAVQRRFRGVLARKCSGKNRHDTLLAVKVVEALLVGGRKVCEKSVRGEKV